MTKKKKWKAIGSRADLEKVVPGKRVRNNQTGEEFIVVKVNGIVDGVLQIEARPISPSPQSFEYRDGKWEFV